MAYTDLAEMTTLVRSLTGFTDRDTLIQRYLEDSAGTDPNNVKTYRPYFSASFLIKLDKQTQQITSADGVTFSNSGTSDPTGTMNLPALINGFMDMQLRLDQALELTVPPGFAAVVDLGTATVMSIIVAP